MVVVSGAAAMPHADGRPVQVGIAPAGCDQVAPWSVEIQMPPPLATRSSAGAVAITVPFLLGANRRSLKAGGRPDSTRAHVPPLFAERHMPPESVTASTALATNGSTSMAMVLPPNGIVGWASVTAGANGLAAAAATAGGAGKPATAGTAPIREKASAAETALMLMPNPPGPVTYRSRVRLLLRLRRSEVQADLQAEPVAHHGREPGLHFRPQRRGEVPLRAYER